MLPGRLSIEQAIVDKGYREAKADEEIEVHIAGAKRKKRMNDGGELMTTPHPLLKQ